MMPNLYIFPRRLESVIDRFGKRRGIQHFFFSIDRKFLLATIPNPRLMQQSAESDDHTSLRVFITLQALFQDARNSSSQNVLDIIL